MRGENPLFGGAMDVKKPHGPFFIGADYSPLKLKGDL
jgi:hypothetical protein